MSVISPIRPPDIYYPDSDGKPMAESDIHRKLLLSLDFAIRHFFRNDPMTYAAANMLLYYVEGEPKVCVAPDVFVVRGIEKHDRRSYQVWAEGKAPDLVIELTSPSTRHEDLGNKRAVYADLGVREYFIFDPLGEYLTPRLRGYRLVGDEYVPMNGGPLASEVLGLELRVEEEQLRLFDPARGEYLLYPDELQMEAQKLEQENARLRAELERLRGGN